MDFRRIRILSLLLVGVLSQVVPAGSAYANCDAPIFHGLTSSFEECGPNAVAFAWFHGRAVQGTIQNAVAGATPGPAGHDSGILQTLPDSMMIDGPNGGAPNGSYLGTTDFNNPGYDGCLKNTTEGTSACTGGIGIDFGVLDYAIGGVDPTAPNVGRVALVSVDFNEGFQAWLLDNAGAPAVDGNACNIIEGDAGSGNPNPVNCTAIPIPTITQFSPAVGGQNVTLSIGSTAAIPILDDCLIAEDKTTNCPRNLNPVRVLVYKHGACTGSGAAGERRVWTYPPQPAAGTLNVLPNWGLVSVEDENLNGVLDAGEDGTNGGTVNNRLDPFIITGTGVASTTIRVPAVPGATDCIFLALAMGVDDNHFSVNPPNNSIFGEMVLLPVVSVNPTPIRAGTGTPVSDLVTTLAASKSQGKATVSWETGIEMATAGFNVIGTKRNGGETRLNGSLILAKEGTSGRGAAYSITFDVGQLKGSTSVFVELLKTDGTQERFGPASFQ